MRVRWTVTGLRVRWTVTCSCSADRDRPVCSVDRDARALRSPAVRRHDVRPPAHEPREALHRLPPDHRLHVRRGGHPGHGRGMRAGGSPGGQRGRISRVPYARRNNLAALWVFLRCPRTWKLSSFIGFFF